LKLKKQKKLSNERKIREENNWDKIFLLHLKKSLYIIIIWASLMIIHNLIYRFSGFDEAFFTIIALYIMPFYLLMSIIYTLLKHKRLDRA